MAIIYQGEGLTLSSDDHATLLEVCLNHKIAISHVCEGMASCGTCRVIVTEGLESLPPRVGLELEMADDRGFKENERLACQLPGQGNFSFLLPEDTQSR